MMPEKGQGLVEYALLVVLVAIALILILQLTGVRLSDVYCSVASGITGEETCTQGGENYCSDDFSSELDGWDTLTGAWKSGDGQVCTAGSAWAFNQCSLEMNVSNYTVSLDGVSLTKGNGYGIVFRASEAGKKFNGYTFQYDPGYGGGAFIFRKWVNGRELSPFAVAPASGFDWYGSPKDVQLVVNGNQFTAYVDGQPVLTGSDSTYTEGGVGLRSWDGSEVCFDNFSIGPVP